MGNVSYRDAERGLHESGLRAMVNAHKREFQMLTGGLWDDEVRV